MSKILKHVSFHDQKIMVIKVISSKIRVVLESLTLAFQQQLRPISESRRTCLLKKFKSLPKPPRKLGLSFHLFYLLPLVEKLWLLSPQLPIISQTKYFLNNLIAFF